MPTYTSTTAPSVPAEHGVAVTTGGLALTGPRLVFQSHSNWVKIPKAGEWDDAGGQDPGIFTTGQMQCIAVIAATFTAGWSARLVHISHPNHSLLDEIDDFIQHNNNVYLAIGAKPQSFNWMMQIRNRFAANVQDVWIYQGTNAKSPDFGMNSAGYFGETVQWKSAH
jgi:hypothetical protein